MCGCKAAMAGKKILFGEGFSSSAKAKIAIK
jgi:hypothetical protein